MKRLTLLVSTALILLGAVLVYGQDNSEAASGQSPRKQDGAAMSPENRLARLSQQLNLTGDQKTKIKPILQDEGKQAQSVRNDTSLSRQDRFAKMQEIRKNTFGQIRPILTSDQQAKLDNMLQQQEQRRGHGGRRGQLGGQPGNSGDEPANPQ